MRFLLLFVPKTFDIFMESTGFLTKRSFQEKENMV